MGNPIMSLLTGNSQNNQNGSMSVQDIVFSAMGAMARGESPQEFLMKVQQQHPNELAGIDPNNLEEAGTQLCEAKGIDKNQAINKAQSIMGMFFGKK